MSLFEAMVSKLLEQRTGDEREPPPGGPFSGARHAPPLGRVHHDYDDDETGVERPAWMTNREFLPKAPPGRIAR